MDILHFLRNSVQAYDRASDAFVGDVGLSTSMGVWALLIAAGLVGIEWLVARRRGRR